ncbi:MAG TPA: type II secretion system protein [Candidatus Acidoferrales bacterium]|nr:type II secretion system protein [Candidatus Acidoferrales bacterium]
MKRSGEKIRQRNRWTRNSCAGMTLLELIVACGILITLAGMAVPMARVTIKRQREAELRYDLRGMRDAVDRYKDAADHNLIRVEVGTEGYPPDLQTLVDGVDLAGAPNRHVRFLRGIPVDPMTGSKDWGMRSVQDDADSDSWGGQDVFDVFTKSQGVALDGTNYKDW